MGRALKDLWRNAAAFVVFGLRNSISRGGGEDRARERKHSPAVYLPETERYGHYSLRIWRTSSTMVLHYDHSRAVEPPDRNSEWDDAELPETFPSGL